MEYLFQSPVVISTTDTLELDLENMVAYIRTDGINTKQVVRFREADNVRERETSDQRA